jgi:hypothetical protein
MNVAIDRIELSLHGIGAGDARLLEAELPAAIEARLAGGPDDTSADDGPLDAALRGRALVAAVAARLADAIGREAQRAAEAQDDHRSPSGNEGAAPWL